MSFVKQRYFQVLAIGTILFAATDVTIRFTDNVNYFPTIMMLGAFLIPLVFVVYFYQQERIFEREPHIGSIIPTVLMCALLGGLIGTLAAGTLEFVTLTKHTISSLIWIGPIEEAAKLVVPVGIFIVMRNRFRSQLDGLLFGVAAGMAFAALETMGYELVSLVTSGGDLNVLNETILIRGLLSPAGHGSWTGLVTATLWRERERTGKSFSPMVVGFFLLAAALHSCWDLASASSNTAVVYLSYAGISAISLSLLFWRLRQARGQQVQLKVATEPRAEM